MHTHTAHRATGKAGNGKQDGNGKRKFVRSCRGRDDTELSPVDYRLHESQGRVGLRTHGGLILFMSRTRKNCGGGG